MLDPEYYLDWLANLREDGREFGTFMADHIETIGDLDYHYQQFYDDLVMLMDENREPNNLYLLGKGERAIEAIKRRLIKKFNIPAQPGEDEDTGEVSGNLFGKRVVTKTFKATLVSAGATRRKQLFTSLRELAEYISDVPDEYIQGIEEVLNDKGEIIGFYVWVG